MASLLLTYAIVGGLSGLLTLWMAIVSGYPREHGWNSVWMGVTGAVLMGPFSLATNLRALWSAWTGSVR
jgi:hypothetical protein